MEKVSSNADNAFRTPYLLKLLHKIGNLSQLFLKKKTLFHHKQEVIRIQSKIKNRKKKEGGIYLHT